MRMLSFIIPAHNEERWIGRCVDTIHAAMEKVDEKHEVVVVDDASTDSTGEIARQKGARLLRVQLRKISAVRNAGAREATGDIFFFVDADTQINKRAVNASLAALRAGAAGGGCVFEFDRRVQWWARILHRVGCIVARLIRWAGGCFLFCTRDTFAAIGGFSETLTVGEDIAFCQAVKKIGRFVVPKPTVITSARKLDVVGPWEVIKLLTTIALRGPRYESETVADFMYGQRAQECRKATR